MAGFGSRGGLRRVGVVRKDDSIAMTTPALPAWRPGHTETLLVTDAPNRPSTEADSLSASVPDSSK
jgi:hypothetical protein